MQNRWKLCVESVRKTKTENIKLRSADYFQFNNSVSTELIRDLEWFLHCDVAGSPYHHRVLRHGDVRGVQDGVALVLFFVDCIKVSHVC